MCGFYGYNIPCPNKLRNKKCQRIHCPIVRKAFQIFERNRDNGFTTSPEEIKSILEVGLEEIPLAVEARRLMYDKYPLRPMDKDEFYAR